MTRAAVIQLCSGTSVTDNLQHAHALLTQAARQGAALAVLPENFVLMGQHEQDKLKCAERGGVNELGDGPIQQWLHHTARELGLWIVAGTMPLVASDGRATASCLVVDEQGGLRARYDKLHLFDVEVDDATGRYRESATLQPGERAVCVQTPIGKLGLAICYDIRFPELFRHLQTLGAEVLVLPAAFTVPTGEAHWDVLLRARAIENLCYLLASGQGGLHANGRSTYGHSMVVDYWGRVLQCAPATGEAVVVAEIELPALHAQRQRFPALTHRREWRV